MKRFFSLRSSTSRGENSNKAAPSNNESNATITASSDVNDGSQSPKGCVLRPYNRHLVNEVPSKQYLQRSASLSSATISYGKAHLRPSGNFSKQPSNCRNSENHNENCPNHCQLLPPERLLSKKRGDLPSHDIEFYSSGSREPFSSGSSSCNSPIGLRGRADLNTTSGRTENQNLYIEGHQVDRSDHDYCSYSSGVEIDNCLGNTNVLPGSGRPTFQYMRSSLPTYAKENFRSHSFRETNHVHDRSTRAWINDHLNLASPSRQARNEMQDDLSNGQPSLTLNGSSEMHVSEVSSSFEDMKEYCAEDAHNVEGRTTSLEKAIRVDNKNSARLQEEETDEDLQRKEKELENKLILLSAENSDMVRYMSKSSCFTTMFHIIQNINEDRKCLAVELSSQIKSRLSERFSAEERLKQSKEELDTRTRLLEKEKNEIQLSLEQELDRRSNDWSLQHAKFESEEQRLRERVRELAEQNVALQRELSSLKANQVDYQNNMCNSERQLNELTASFNEVRAKNNCLQQSLSELQDRYNRKEADSDGIWICYKEKEKENRELQKAIVKLQRMCGELEKTVSGLRQGLNDDLYEKSSEGSDTNSRLQIELVRLTGVEQMLRKEVQSNIRKIESLRFENNSLLGRLQDSGNFHAHSSTKLDRELHARVDYLQTQGLSLLNDSSSFLGELLELFKRKQYEQETRKEFGGIIVDEYILKYENLRRGIENFRRNLQKTFTILDDKYNLEILASKTTEDGELRNQKSQDEIEYNLKVEAILSRLLEEILCSRELEYEQLQADLANSIRSHDVLQNANQRMQDEFSSLSHKMKDLELQISRKDEIISQLHQEIHVSKKDLTAVQNFLQEVSKERDEMREEMKHLQKTNMLMDNEVSHLRKKIENLDEEILIKEGQISILKDSLKKPFDTIYSHTTAKEFILE